MRLSRAMVLPITAAALLFALVLPRALVNLLLIGYDGVSQFFPGVVLGLFWKRVTSVGVISGLLTGLALVVALVFGGHDPIFGINAGFVALVANVIITVVVSILSGASRPGVRRPQETKSS